MMAPFFDRRFVIVTGLGFWVLSLLASLWMVLLVRGLAARVELLEGQFQVEIMAHTAQVDDLETRLHILEARK